jgi:hypothetical protein
MLLRREMKTLRQSYDILANKTTSIEGKAAIMIIKLYFSALNKKH